MDLKLDYTALADTAEQDKKTVEDAVKRVLRTVDAIVRHGDDPEEVVEHLDWLAGQGKRSRSNVREHRPIAALTAGSSTPASTQSKALETLDAIANGYGCTVDQLVERWKQPMLQLQRISAPKRNHVAAVVGTILGDPDLVKDDEAKLKIEEDVSDLRRQLSDQNRGIESIGRELGLNRDECGDARVIRDKIRELKEASEGTPGDERFKQRLHEVGNAVGADDPGDVRQIKAKIRELREERTTVEAEILEKFKKAVASTFRSRIILAKERLPEDYVEQLSRR